MPLTKENDNGCPLQLDSNCVFYGTNNNGKSALTASGLPNGVSLSKVLEAHELMIGQLLSAIKILQSNSSQ